MKKIIVTIILLFAAYSHSQGQNNKKSIPTKSIVVFNEWALNLKQLKLISKSEYTKNDIFWNVNNLPSHWGGNGQKRLESEDFIPVHNQQEIMGYIKVYEQIINNAAQGVIIEYWDKSKRNKIWTFINQLWASANCASVISDKNLLYIVTFNLISSGSDLVCLDQSTGKLIWNADVEQLMIGHSKYSNEVFISKYENLIILAGDEAGGQYLQLFNAKTGKKVFAKLKKEW